MPLVVSHVPPQQSESSWHALPSGAQLPPPEPLPLPPPLLLLPLPVAPHVPVDVSHVPLQQSAS